MSFATDIAKFAKKTNRNILDVRKTVFFNLSTMIIINTPVDKGRARGNWVPKLHDFAHGVVEPVSLVQITAEIKAIGDSARGDDTLTLVNNLPYILKLEYGGYNDGPKVVGGFSRQAPAGMVRISVSGYQKMIRKQIRSFT